MPICINLAVVDDSILEDTEDLFVALNSTDEAVLFTRNLTRIFILNADGMCSEYQKIFNFFMILMREYPVCLICAVVSVGVPTNITVGEGGGVAVVCAVLLGMIERSVDIILSTEDGTALGEPCLLYSAYRMDSILPILPFM